MPRLLPNCFSAALLLFLSAGSPAWWQSANSPVGVFENHGDVGTVLHAGSVEYDAAKRTYSISGSGENISSIAPT